MSPVAKWQTQYFSLIRGACVPLPVISRIREAKSRFRTERDYTQQAAEKVDKLKIKPESIC